VSARTWQVWAHVQSWHDGDTWLGYVDLGAHVYLGTNDRPIRFRCAKIQAPELSTGKPGADATEVARALVPAGDYPATSFGLDNYGRPLVDLHLSDGRLFSDAMLAARQAVAYRS
jgi:endonuclease YncB( thermonuclease family)